jgi:hypothetical protein
MGYELFGRLHAAVVSLRDERGQGTIEYVGLVLLLAVLLGGIVAAAKGSADKQGIAEAIIKKLKGVVGGLSTDGLKKT